MNSLESMLSEFVEEHQIEAEVKFFGLDHEDMSNRWICTLRRPQSAEHVIAIVRIGIDWNGLEPTAADALVKLAHKAAVVEHAAGDIDEWCRLTGPTFQSWHSSCQLLYRADKEDAAKLSKLLGEAPYKKLLMAVQP